MNILNEKIPNYKTYMDDVDLTLNKYKKHLKQEVVSNTKQVDNVKFTID